MRIASILFFLFLALPYSKAQKFSYQTVLRDVTRQVLVQREVQFQFSLLQDSPNGPEVYVETQLATTNQFGLVNLIIGTGTVQSGTLMDLEWGEYDFYLQVEIDPEGGTDFQLMGSAELLPVPTALHANTSDWELSDEDRDPTNEFQMLSKSGDEIVLSDGGGSILLLDDNPSNEFQTITKNGAEIRLSNNGGAVSLNDDDPSNEIQDISLEFDPVFNRLSIGGGVSTVSLSSLQDGLWNSVGFNRINYNGQVGIGTTSYSGNLTVNRSLSINRTIGGLTQLLTTFTEVVGGGAYFAAFGNNGQENMVLSSLVQDNVTYLNNGFLALHGPAGISGGLPRVGMFVDPDGRGTIIRDREISQIGNPLNAQESFWYASAVGPETAVFERGTASLENGEAFVPFSEHYRLICTVETMTVQLTPLSASSKGLALVKKMADGFIVKELHDGHGNYDFDWEVKSVRLGYESEQVIQSTAKYQAAPPISSPQ